MQNFQGRTLFMNWRIFFGENFRELLACAANGHYAPKLKKKTTFVNSHKTSKFAKVFRYTIHSSRILRPWYQMNLQKYFHKLAENMIFAERTFWIVDLCLQWTLRPQILQRKLSWIVTKWQKLQFTLYDTFQVIYWGHDTRWIYRETIYDFKVI